MRQIDDDINELIMFDTTSSSGDKKAKKGARGLSGGISYYVVFFFSIKMTTPGMKI